MATDERYQKNLAAPPTITDELYNGVGSGANTLGDIQRAFKGSTDFVIRTASGGGGVLLVENTDYTLGGEDTYLTAEAGYTVYTTYTITNATYQSGDLYFTYKAIGSYTDANDIDTLEDSITANTANIATNTAAITAVPTGIYRQAIINGGAEVARRAAPSLSTSWQYGEVARMMFKAAGTAVSAGTIEQTDSSTLGTTGWAAKLAGVTITGTGIISMAYLMESKDAKKFKSQTASLSIQVGHDVGSAIDYTVAINKPTVKDDFTSVTTISTDSAVSVSTTDTLEFENISLGDCSNGIEILITVECGAVTTKNFEFTELQFNKGAEVLSFVPGRDDCDRYYELLADYDDATYGNIGSGHCQTTTVAFITVKFAKKRTPAYTLDIQAQTDFRVFVVTAPSTTAISFSSVTRARTSASVQATVAAGLTAGQGCTLSLNNIAGSFFAIDAELYK